MASEPSAPADPTPTIDQLLNLVPDAPAAVLAHLARTDDRALASAQDAHGYSLLHAAVSYGHAALARALVRDHGVAVDLRDEDGETALFAAESAALAALLVRELGADRGARNADGCTAAEKLAAEGEWPDVVEFLQGEDGVSGGGAASAREGTEAGAPQTDAESASLPHPPPLPNGVRINVGTMSDADVGGEPDPEFRRRIEQLAARGDFEGEEGQAELRRLVQDAVSGMAVPDEGQGPATRRRVG